MRVHLRAEGVSIGFFDNMNLWDESEEEFTASALVSFDDLLEEGGYE